MNIVCPTCTHTIHAPSRTCHWCGHDLDGRESDRELAGPGSETLDEYRRRVIEK